MSETVLKATVATLTQNLGENFSLATEDTANIYNFESQSYVGLLHFGEISSFLDVYGNLMAAATMTDRIGIAAFVYDDNPEEDFQDKLVEDANTADLALFAISYIADQDRVVLYAKNPKSAQILF